MQRLASIARRWCLPAVLFAAASTACGAATGPGASARAPSRADDSRAATHPALPAAAPLVAWVLPEHLAREQLPAADPGATAARTYVLPALKSKKPAAKTAAPAGSDPDAIAIAPLSPMCERYVRNKPSGGGACTSALALDRLDEAMAVADPVGRDARLLALEACDALRPGLMRALRAELAPAGCADALVEPMLAGKAPPPADVAQVLYALGVAARLRRTAVDPPALTPPFDRARVLEFVNGPMAAWTAQQAAAVERLSRLGVDLSFYARGIAAVEAGMADLRIVEAFRSVPIPAEMAKDSEVRDAYYGTLEQMLEPRKGRGRDASLVGLRDLASVGVLEDARVEQARALLSKMFGGRRIDALDALVLPALDSSEPASAPQRLAARLPTWYSGQLLAPELVRDPAVLRQFVMRGVPMAHRRALQALDTPAELRRLMLRYRIGSAQKYWRALDVDEAIGLASGLGAGASALDQSITLELAVALSMHGGPLDAADMMRRAPALSLGLGGVASLDALANTEAAPMRGIAALDAAIVLQVSPPSRYDSAFWRSLAERYAHAGQLLADPSHRQIAEQRAKAAQELAAASQ